MIASQGRYSILTDSWVQPPAPTHEVDQEAIQAKADRIRRTIDVAIEMDDQGRLEALMARLKAFRHEGLEDEGEYSLENQVYKELRRTGDLFRLKEAALREYDESLSYAKEQQLPGGLGDGINSSDVDQSQLDKGRDVEMEHTNDPRVATEIATDHLAELPDYYDRLQQVEKNSCHCDGQTNPQRYAKSDWVPYTGPSGGKGWQHVSTGRIEYGDEPPGGDDEGDAFEPDMSGAESPAADDGPNPWDSPAEPAQPNITEPVPDPSQLTPAERAVQPDHVQAQWRSKQTPAERGVQPADVQAQWRPKQGAQGEQLWQHPQTGETVLGKEAPSASKAADIAAQARAAGPAKRPAAPQPAAQPGPASPASQPSAAPAKPAGSQKGFLTRTWHGGMGGTGSVEFQDETHRDLFDIAAKRSKAMRAGNLSDSQRQKLHQDAAALAGKVARELGVDEQTVNQMSMDVHKAGKEQAKGIKDGEHRKLTSPHKTSGQPAPDAPQQSGPPQQPQPTATQPASPTPDPAQPGGASGKHPHTDHVNSLPDGTQLFGFTKETPPGLGMSVWTNGDDALGTQQLLEEHGTPEHQAELEAALQANPQPAPGSQQSSAGGGRQQQPPDRAFSPEETHAVHSAAAIFGIAPGDIGNDRQTRNFILRTARNVGFNPHSVAGDKTDRTVAAAKFLAQHKPHLDAMVKMAQAYGWGGGSGRELAHKGRHAGLHLVKAAAQRGYDPEGNTEAEHIAGAITFLQEHEKTSAAQQHTKQQAVTQALGQLFNTVKQTAGDYASGRRKITAMDIALAAIGFYVGYRMVKQFRRRRRMW